MINEIKITTLKNRLEPKFHFGTFDFDSFKLNKLYCSEIFPYNVNTMGLLFKQNIKYVKHNKAFVVSVYSMLWKIP